MAHIIKKIDRFLWNKLVFPTQKVPKCRRRCRLIDKLFKNLSVLKTNLKHIPTYLKPLFKSEKLKKEKMVFKWEIICIENWCSVLFEVGICGVSFFNTLDERPVWPDWAI